MNNVFRITITAVDKATAVVRRVKSAASQIIRPITDMKSVVTSLGKETGLDKVGRSILDIANATGSLASKMSGVFPALGGGLGVAALAALAGRWGDLGAGIDKTARSLDITSGQFQEFNALARHSDVAPEALTGGLKSLSATMEDVFYHRAGPEAMTALRQMGLQFHQTASGAPDLVRAFMDVADATKKLQGNSQAQRKLLESLGLSEDLLPVFRKGADGLRSYVEEYRKTHGMISDDDIRRATAFKDSMINLGDALSGVATRIAASASELTDFNNAMAIWIGGGKSPFADFSLKDAIGPVSYAAAKTVQYALDPSEAVLDGASAIAESMPNRALRRSQNLSATAGITGAETGLTPKPSAGSGGIYIDSPAPSVDAMTSAAATVSPKMSLEVILKGAPPGTQAIARLPNGNEVPARVEYSMPTTVTP